MNLHWTKGKNGRMYPPTTDRFLKFVKKPDDHKSCWLWTGTHCGKSGRYGHFRLEGRDQMAHRVSYRLFKGDIPKGMSVCHSCDNVLCVNPDHLWLGTHQQNMVDAVVKGRWRKADKTPSKLTPELVKEIRGKFTGVRGNLTALAKEYGIPLRTMCDVTRGVTWKCVGHRTV